MTDNEIIKALECCSNEDVGCEDCPANDCCCNDAFCMTGAILDLIKRQKAEIKEKSQRLREILPIVAELKAEAIKEFAESVKMEFYREFDEIIPSIMADRIENLVKEMMGGNHD